MNSQMPVRAVVNIAELPDQFPTHRHHGEFWESLGRAVATFGFLEEVLGRAIFALTATRPYHEAEVQKAYTEWLPKLERALTDQLGDLITAYDKAMRNHPKATTDDLNDLVATLRKAAELRNVLCHGSWRTPSVDGTSVPFFVNRQKLVFDTPIDVGFLNQVQRHTSELTCAVVSTVTRMGRRFPGGEVPRQTIWAQ